MELKNPTGTCSASPISSPRAVWGRPEYLKSHQLLTSANVFNMKLSPLVGTA